MAEVGDVTGCGLSGDGLPFAAVVVWLQGQALLLGLDLLGLDVLGRGRPEYRPVLIQLILQPLDQLILLIQLQLQLIDQGVSLP